MKKLIAFLFSFAILIFSIFSFEFQKPEQFLQVDYSLDTKGYEGNKVGASFEYGALWNNLKLCSGFQFDGDVFDFSIISDFSPDKFQFISEKKTKAFGLNLFYHFQKQEDIARENDFCFCGYYKYLHKNGFEFRTVLGYGFKITNVFVLRDDFGLLWDNNLFLGFFFIKDFSNGIKIYYSVKNYDMYRFYLIDHPIHTFGLNYKYEQLLFIGEFEAKFTDQFKSTPCIDGLTFKLSMRCFL